MDKSYSKLVLFPSWQERLKYLQLQTHDFDSPRFMNSSVYKTRRWINFKSEMHRRDYGCDLGVLGVYIEERMILHHINPVTIDDIENWNEQVLFNPENVITCAQTTHNKIHYLQELTEIAEERQPGDTKLW